jgi:putative membrane protein
MIAGVSPDERHFDDPTRRTYLAEERTLLAWWRSGLAALAVSLAVGRLLPAVLGESTSVPFGLLGLGFALLGLFLFVVGAYRHRSVEQALERGSYRSLQSWLVWTITIAMLLLGVGTLLLVLAEI